MKEPNDNSTLDQFEFQRQWVIEVVDKDPQEYVQEGTASDKKTACGAPFMVKKMAYKIITAKGCNAFGNVLGEEVMANNFIFEEMRLRSRALDEIRRRLLKYASIQD